MNVVFLLVLLLLVASSLAMLVSMVRSDGLGHRPPPASWVGEDAHRTWPR